MTLLPHVQYLRQVIRTPTAAGFEGQWVLRYSTSWPTFWPSFHDCRKLPSAWLPDTLAGTKPRTQTLVFCLLPQTETLLALEDESVVPVFFQKPTEAQRAGLARRVPELKNRFFLICACMTNGRPEVTRKALKAYAEQFVMLADAVVELETSTQKALLRAFSKD